MDIIIAKRGGKSTGTSMKVYLLTDKDFEKLTAEIDRDPMYGERGGSGVSLSADEMNYHHEAHRFFNYVIRRWISSVKESE